MFVVLRPSLNCCIQIILMAVSSFQEEELPNHVQLVGSSLEPEPGKNLCYGV
jgi:hypothetical protein